MKKIFICIPWFLPAYKAGGPIQSIANLVESLDKKEYRFFIFCGNKELDGKAIDNIETDHWVSYSSNCSVWYVSKNCFSAFKHEIKIIQPDILFINGIYSWHYNFLPLLYSKTKTKIISVRGMLHPGALSQKSFKKKIYLSLWKFLGLHKKNLFHATDKKEQEYIQNTFGVNTKIKIAANFPRMLPRQLVAEKNKGSLKLISIALISPMKNIKPVLETLLKVKERVEYNIYGPVKEERYWQECLTLIKKMPSNITVNYHGDIHPDKIANALSQNHVFILPSKSENFGHAIYEALASGRPVITSNNTPWNELVSYKSGINVSIDNFVELQEAIEKFAAMSEEELGVWSMGARAYAEGAIDLEIINQQYTALFT